MDFTISSIINSTTGTTVGSTASSTADKKYSTKGQLSFKAGEEMQSTAVKNSYLFISS